MQDNQIISELIVKARAAQAQAENYTQEQIDNVCLAVGWEVYNDENIKKLAEKAVSETGMGNAADKIIKHKVKVLGVLKDIKGARSVGIIERDEPRGISKDAKPVGVIGALTPVTNPTATPSSNCLSIIKGRNAVIFAPHPGGKESCGLTVEFMRKGLAKVGAPADLIQYIKEPSIELSNELMKQCDLVVATGGPAMVKAAYASGTPAYGVGAGNSVQIIAEDADIADAIKKVTISKIFDYATSCSSENSIIVEAGIYEKTKEEIIKNKGYICSTAEKETLKNWMWVPNKKGIIGLNAKIIAQSAVKIAKDAGLRIPENTVMLVVEGTEPGAGDKFSAEKLSPVLTMWKYSGIENAIDITEKLTNYSGYGHSCGIHTFRGDYIDKLALKMKSSRIMVRQPQAPANGGNFFNGMPSTVTLGCGTWGGNITTENITYKHFLNITWVSEPITPDKPSDTDIWGNFWKKYGK